MALSLAVALVVGGIALLFLGAEALIGGAARLGVRYRVSPMIVGITVVSFGTSLPELVVCVLAALRGSPDLAVGNILGSNMANVGLVLGFTALMRPLRTTRALIRREIPVMLGATFILLPIFLNGWVGRWEGVLLLGVLALYLVLLGRALHRNQDGGAKALSDEVPGDAAKPLTEMQEEATAAPGSNRPVLGKNLMLATGGTVLLVLGGHGIVEGAVTLGDAFGVPELVIGLSVLAVGTSLPELATSVVAALRGKPEIAVGNVVGSNLFNLTLVLGTTAVVSPVAVAPHVLLAEYPAVVLLSLLMLPAAWTGRKMVRGEGLLFLGVYALCWVWIVSI